MSRNPQRRAALVDAAIEVLAREGARGLTFRAVDAEASVPTGTATNYFANRDELFDHVGRKIHERMGLEPDEVERITRSEPNRALVADILRAMMDRAAKDRSGYLALLELRLESTRRPELQAVLTRTTKANLDQLVQGHTAAGYPGDGTTAVLLYLGVSWLIVEHLTLPAVLAPMTPESLIAALVERTVPAE